LAVLDGARFMWVSAQCVDGVLELAKTGFERSLRSEVHGTSLRFSYDTRVAQPDCVSTEVWTLQPEAAGQWQFTPDAQVSLPAGAPCGAAADTVGHGVIRLTGDTLEELRFGSAWCRGFDVRFLYRRVPNTELTDDQLLRRYFAHWNRRDAPAVAALFAEHGQLVEPFTRAPDGAPVRHEGRAAIETWLASAFATTPWLAFQLRSIEPLTETGQILAVWNYRDARLAEPLAGRNLFVLAGGEIFATELQLLTEPVKRSSDTLGLRPP
jgi:ketosteroid isomerase-like protein